MWLVLNSWSDHLMTQIFNLFIFYSLFVIPASVNEWQVCLGKFLKITSWCTNCVISKNPALVFFTWWLMSLMVCYTCYFQASIQDLFFTQHFNNQWSVDLGGSFDLMPKLCWNGGNSMLLCSTLSCDSNSCLEQSYVWSTEKEKTVAYN